MKKVLFTATVDSHILAFHVPFLKMFKEKGYEVHVATNGTADIPYCDVKHIISFERSPFKINNLKAIFALRKIINNEKYEIIHTHTPMGSFVTRLAAISARKNGTKVIYTAHGFHFYKGAPILNWLLYYPAEKIMAKFTDILITINMEDYDLAKNKFKTDVRYIPGVGINLNKFNKKMTKQQKDILKSSLGIKNNDFVMIYIAELILRKNHSMAISAMKKLIATDSNIKLLFAGKDSLNGKLQKIVKEQNLEKNIIFLGFRSDIAELIQISDLAISTSIQEGLAVGIMESLAAGLPVVGTDIRGHIKEIELVELNDVDQLVKKITDIKSGKIKPISSLPKKYQSENVLKYYELIYAE